MIRLAIAFTLMISAVAAAPAEPQIKILKSTSDISPDGHYQFAYETENGISAEETGSLVGSGPDAALSATGSYKYTAPDGTPIQIVYTAGAEGFVPTGDAIPTPPPIPEAIQKSLAYNEAHPEPESSEASSHKGFLLTSF